MRRFLSIIFISIFLLHQAVPVSARVSSEEDVSILPLPGTMVRPSEHFNPVIVKGLRVHPESPLQFDFIVDTGSAGITDSELKPRAAALIKYFLTALTVPDDELWVNLSPYEQDRIIPDNFGVTGMGRDLLSQDYLLKQLTASLMYPEDEVGRAFWDKVHQRAQQLFGTTDIEVETFNKVWVVPDTARIQVSGDVAFIAESRLKVMMEEDYLALQQNALAHQPGEQDDARGRSARMKDVSARMVKEVLIPVIEEEVNYGKHFAPLRQIYHSLILATWYKQNLRESYLSRVYVGENKVDGIDDVPGEMKKQIYDRYLQAFRKGVYNYVREEYDAGLQATIPRKYFSGGMRFGAETFADVLHVEHVPADAAVLGLSRRVAGELRTVPTNVMPVDAPRSDAAVLARPETAVDLGDFITQRKLYLSDPATGRDVRTALYNPGAFQSAVQVGQSQREPAKIDFLITRQAPIQQSILELIANAADAITGRSAAIGRFGVGALQMLAFVLEKDSPALNAGTVITVDTRTADGPARKIQFFKGDDGRVKFNVVDGTRAVPGTKVRIQFGQGLDPETRALIEGFVENRMNLFTKMPVQLNGRLINPLDDHIFLNGDKVRYDYPAGEVRVELTADAIVVEDFGSGMSDSVIVDKYLIPRRGENQDFRHVQSDEEIDREVHLFYKGPQLANKPSESRIVFQVGGINIQSQTVEGYGLPRELIVQLPSSTKLTVSRDKIEIDETTHTAIRAIARKIVEGKPIHQFALMNGFMRAVKLLDEANTRVEALQPLVDTAKEVFIPMVMRHTGLILPNDDLFRQMKVPSDTLFLDESLTYKITPGQIPGARDLEQSFQPGRFVKAYTVPFREGADVTFLEAGPYLLINEAVYERYREEPMMLNLRLNYYHGYGRRNKPRGWIVSPPESGEVAASTTDIHPVLVDYTSLKKVLSQPQRQWLQRYFELRGLPTMQEVEDALRRGETPYMDHVPAQILVAILRRARPRDQDAAAVRGRSSAVSEDLSAAAQSGPSPGVSPREERRRGFIAVNKDIDASETRVRDLFAVLDKFVAAVPQALREQVDWDQVFAMNGQTGMIFESLLEHPERIVAPDAEFLAVHHTFFANREHPDRLLRYLKNLLQAGHVFTDTSDPVIHRIIAVSNTRGLAFAGGDILALVRESFANKNMESLEEAFAGINEGMPHVSGDGIARLMRRWLRIYNQDPHTAAVFRDGLRRTYASEEFNGASASAYQLLDRPRDTVKNVHSGALTPDGTRRVMVHDRFVFVDNVETGERMTHYEDIHGEGNRITSNIVITPDSRLAVSGDDKGKILAWELDTGAYMSAISGHSGEVKLLRLTPDGRHLISYGADAKIRIHHVGRPQVGQDLEGDFTGIQDLTITPDGETLIVTKSGGGISVYDIATGSWRFGSHDHLAVRRNQLVTLPPAEQHYKMAVTTLVTPDSRYAVVFGEDVIVYDLRLRKPARWRQGSPSDVKGQVLSRDGTKLLVPMKDLDSSIHQIGVFDFETLVLYQILQGHDDKITNITQAPNGKDFISHGRDGKIKVWHVRDYNGEVDLTHVGTPRQVIDADPKSATRMEFSQDGEWFMLSNEEGARTGDIQIGRARPVQSPVLDIPYRESGRQISFGSPDGETLVTVSPDDNTVRLWDTQSGKAVNVFTGSAIPAHQIKDIKVVGDAVAIISSQYALEIWSRQTSRRQRTVTDLVAVSANGRYFMAREGSGVIIRPVTTAHESPPMRFPERHDANFVADASGKTMVLIRDNRTGEGHLFDIERMRPGRTVPREVRWHKDMQLTSDGRYLAVPSPPEEKVWEFWDLETGAISDMATQVRRVHIVPGQNLAVLERLRGPHLEVIDLTDGRVIRSLRTRRPFEPSANNDMDWQVTPDGHYLVLPTAEDAITQVWDLKSGDLAYELNAFTGRMQITADGKYLVGITRDFQSVSLIDITDGTMINEWRPHSDKLSRVAVSAGGGLVLTETVSGNVRAWSLDKLLVPAIERTGWAALNQRDHLRGIPSLTSTVVRFLREENVELLEQEELSPRLPSWQVVNRLEQPVSLALMNNLYERYAKAIQEHPQMNFDDLVGLIGRLQGRNMTEYESMIRSAIEGQDKTQRAWVREIAVQNARDATRRAREDGHLVIGKGDIEIRNFMHGNDWVFSVRDEGTGMNLYQLVRYFFPLDQSSKDYLNDTGNLGQGNYTLFADFDKVFVRTSAGDGIIHELEITPDENRLPVITRWEVLRGNDRGTEIRRIKNNSKSDPQLESLFIQEALQRFAGAVTSPQQRYRRGEDAQVRDVRILYNNETFSEEIAVTSATVLENELGPLEIGRAGLRDSRRVIQDGIFVRAPDQKELAFVPGWLRTAFERGGGIHIAVPRAIQLNIPRTGYAQEHKFLRGLQVAVLHNVLRTVLRDYIERGWKIPGMPADFFDNYGTVEDPQAQGIVRQLVRGRYGEVDPQLLAEYAANPVRLFALMKYLPFESEAYDGEMTLHEIRERIVVQSGLRGRQAGAVSISQLTQLLPGFLASGEFAADMEESAGKLEDIADGLISGRLQQMVRGSKAEKRDPQEVWDRLPEDAPLVLSYLTHRLLAPVVGDQMPQVGFYNQRDGIRAHTIGTKINWNLAYLEQRFREIMELRDNPALLKELLRAGGEEAVLWQLIQTAMHESQHLPQFEEPGDHTHHDEGEIEGLDKKLDERFGVRMGRALDALLTAPGNGIAAELTRTREEMEAFLRETGGRSPKPQTGPKDSAVLAQDGRDVGGIDLNPERLRLQVDGGAVPVQPVPLPEDTTVPVRGFYPVIINVLPTNLPLLLGSPAEPPEEGNTQLISALRPEDVML